MSTRGPRRRSTSVVADAPVVVATESRLEKAKNAVKNHPFIAGGVASTVGLLALDLATTTAKMSGGDYVQAILIAAAEVATLEAIGYGIYKAAKAAYNNASMPSLEGAKNAGKVALDYASKPFTFGFSALKSGLSKGYNMLPSFKKAATAEVREEARVEAREEVAPTRRRSARLAK